MPPDADDIDRAKQHFFRGLDCFDAGDDFGAEREFRAALAIVPGRVSALVNLAVVLFKQQKITETIAVAKQALATEPNDIDALVALGSAYADLGDLKAASATMEQAVASAPNDPRALMGRASVFAKLDRFDRAIEDYEAARRIDPKREYLLGLLVSARMHACDWRGLKAEIDFLLEETRRGANLITPFSFLATDSTCADQLRCATITIGRKLSPQPALWTGTRYDHDRIRVAYVSGDFRQHPTAMLLDRAIELHDRRRFETFAISYGADDGSAMRRRSVAAFEHFLDFRDTGSDTIARAIRTHEIDIAVDLGGFTDGGRLSIFSWRPAPLQVTYLGYPGTTAAPYIDYIVADRVVIPPEARQYYTEKVVALPDSYQANDDTQPIGAMPTRANCDLPKGGFVFCCFNNTYKITPAMFDGWMRLLAKTPRSVLWLLDKNPVVAGNLRREAAARGVAPDRLIFGKMLPREQHLARLRVADLFLDTLPYNAHTTASDALWAGLPIVTCQGETFASRVAASLLRAMDLPELVTASLADYESLALTLAEDSARLAKIKSKVAANRTTAPLFRSARFTQHLEATYLTMMERHRRGEPPADFAVEQSER